MLPKVLAFEARALAVFRHDSALLLGNLAPGHATFSLLLDTPGHPSLGVQVRLSSHAGFSPLPELREDPRVVHGTGQPVPSSVTQQAHVQSGAI